MERLNLSEKPAHSLQESAIHCARYANILHLVKDKVVFWTLPVVRDMAQHY